MPVKMKPIPELSKSDIARFWAKVDKSPGLGPDGDCWEWTGNKGNGRYGSINIKPGGMFVASRIAYALECGPIPFGLHVLHACDNPVCCNPDHLWLGTQIDNIRDRDAKGRQVARSGNEHGARLHPELVLRGEGIGNSKLTESQVLRIRKQYAAGGITLKALGNQNGVTMCTAWSVVNRKTWAHI